MKITASSSGELSIMEVCKQILEKYLAGTLHKEFKPRVKAVLDVLKETSQS